MFSMTGGIVRYLGLLLLGLAVAGCGGGGDDGGGFTGIDRIDVSIIADRTVLPANMDGQLPNIGGAFTNTLTVEISKNNRIFAAPSVAIDVVTGLESGALYYLDGEDDHEVDCELDGDAATTEQCPGAYRRLVFDDTTGTVTGHFSSSAIAGTVVLRASAQDPDTGETITADLTITVVNDRAVASSAATGLAFTGSYVEAALAGQARFGEAVLQADGSYSRTIGVLATNANGKPVAPNTPINFFLIDGPITGYPGGPGHFTIAGSNGNPLESGYIFDAVGGQFQTQGARPLDLLVLDGNSRLNPNSDSLPNNQFLTGIRTVASISDENSLLIDAQARSFNSGPDQGNTVPYVMGRTLNGAILASALTNKDGMAETVLTYPASRIGQTAILVACTADQSACTVLNTCDAGGANCKSVYLAAANASDWMLTTSATQLEANSTTSVRLCLQDQNLALLPLTGIRYSVDASNATSVQINGSASRQGAIQTDTDGCSAVTIAVTGQQPREDIVIAFTADNMKAPVEITIRAPTE